MTTLNLRKESAQALDIEKTKLEASITVKIERIFRNMANDASNLFLATGNLDNQLLAQNYAPEFLKEIRDALRKSIKRFGFNLRKDVEKKHYLLFNIETMQKFIDLEVKQSIKIEDENLDEKINNINSQFLLASTLFVANESEEQNNYITETNSKMLEKAVIAGIFAYSALIVSKENEAQDLRNRLITASNTESRSINRQLDQVTRQIAESNANQDAIIAKNIKTNLLDKAPARSELISAQNVGLAESWARQTEAELIDDANLISANGESVNVSKTWFAILDSKTRSSHAEADGQEVGVNDFYNVGGEQLKMPRDPSGSAKNIINCRCLSNFSV